MADGLALALLRVQEETPAIQRDAINPHFGSSYVSLESLMEIILPILRKHDLLLLQVPTTVEGGEPGLRTRIEHVPTGEFVQDTMPLVLQKRDPQGQGSAITYARRYSLMAILGLVADKDDDGTAAAPKKTTTRKSTARTKTVKQQDDGEKW